MEGDSNLQCVRPFEFELSTITSRSFLSDRITYLLFKMALFTLLFPHSFKMVISSMFEKSETH